MQVSKCSKCGIRNLHLQETARAGLGSCLSLTCMAEGCGAVTNFHRSRKSRLFHINRLSVLAMRRIGRGYETLRKFTSMTNLPPPVSKTTFFDHQAVVCAAAERVSERSMEAAAAELLEEFPDREVAVTFDGT